MVFRVFLLHFIQFFFIFLPVQSYITYILSQIQSILLEILFEKVALIMSFPHTNHLISPNPERVPIT